MSVAKVGVHDSLSNGHPNLWSNINSEKLGRSETPSCIFARVGIKRVQIAWNIAKVGVHILYQMGIQIYDQIPTPRIWSKVKLHHSISLRFALKEGKIALNITKIFMHSYLTRNLTKICKHLPNGHIHTFTKFALKGSENSSERYESWRVRLFIEMGT